MLCYLLFALMHLLGVLRLLRTFRTWHLWTSWTSTIVTSVCTVVSFSSVFGIDCNDSQVERYTGHWSLFLSPTMHQLSGGSRLLLGVLYALWFAYVTSWGLQLYLLNSWNADTLGHQQAMFEALSNLSHPAHILWGWVMMFISPQLPFSSLRKTFLALCTPSLYLLQTSLQMR